ncbi:MAG: 50S ribosomal protein L11 methyltransferase [Pyrinomonadaceae bacterium]
MKDDVAQWYSIAFTVRPDAAEAIEFALNSLESAGTQIDQLRKAGAETVTVIGYFSELPEESLLQDELNYALRSYCFDADAVHSIDRAQVENADWLAEWKKHWKPTEVGRFVISPPWSEVEGTDKLVIRIEPNMAFGTGTHETTQLCLAEIDRHLGLGESVLDVGTGTGILSIASAMMSGGEITAFDTDTDSVTIARENADLNGVGGRIRFVAGTIDPRVEAHDFVLANLTLDVILPILDLLIDKAGRMLVLSGILASQGSDIRKALGDRGYNDMRIESKGEWISVTLDVS